MNEENNVRYLSQRNQKRRQAQAMFRLRRMVISCAFASVVGFGIVLGVSQPDLTVTAAQTVLGGFGLAGCEIKGNISIDSGERIYHLPGQRYYSETKIASEYGERFFCSEADARSAGWRKSMV